MLNLELLDKNHTSISLSIYITGINMGMTYAAGAGDDVAPAADEDGLTDVDADRRQQARGGVQSAEAWHLVLHGLCHWVAARLRRRAGEVNVRRARFQGRGTRQRLGIRHSGCHRHHRHRRQN